MHPPRLTGAVIEYLRTQRLGRLATVDGVHAPQNNPVGFVVDEATSQVLVGGRDLAATRTYRDVRGNPQVAFVVDDLASVEPWVVAVVVRIDCCGEIYARRADDDEVERRPRPAALSGAEEDEASAEYARRRYAS